MQEDAVRREAKGDRSGPRIFQGADGSIIIDDPSLVGEAKMMEGELPVEEVQKVAMWVASIGQWVPLTHVVGHPYGPPTQPHTAPSEPPAQSDDAEGKY